MLPPLGQLREDPHAGGVDERGEELHKVIPTIHSSSPVIIHLHL
jgi:hypothetical protein